MKMTNRRVMVGKQTNHKSKQFHDFISNTHVRIYYHRPIRWYPSKGGLSISLRGVEWYNLIIMIDYYYIHTWPHNITSLPYFNPPHHKIISEYDMPLGLHLLILSSLQYYLEGLGFG